MDNTKLITTLTKYTLVLTFIITVAGCHPFEEPVGDIVDNITDDLNSIQVPDGFEYNLHRNVDVQVHACDNKGNQLTGIPFSLHKEEGDSLLNLLTGIIPLSGEFNEVLCIDVNTDYLIVNTNYPGFRSGQKVMIEGGVARISLDPRNEIIPYNEEDENEVGNGSSRGRILGLEFEYIGDYNNQGVPDYLEAEDDAVGQNILDLINSNLPEGQPVPDYNPQYIVSGASANLEVEETAEVWVTFVHEGAGYKNALGYYTYETANPPADAYDIDSLIIIYPNVSYSGSGGGLTTGNKVNLGLFEAGTTIGWFLVPNGWDGGSQAVVERDGVDVKFSDSRLNTFTSTDNQSHVVILNDPDAELLFLGIEDINRPGGDKDFNDAVFYITVSPYEAINTLTLPVVSTDPQDDDGDGVNNNDDQFTDDPNIAFANYVPAQNAFGTLAFEDRWPHKGDYDMNDMVLDYNFAEFRNSDNKVIKIRARFIIRAMGAGLRSGFGFEMDIDPNLIQSVDGCQLYKNYINIAANGTESNQSKAVIIPFDNGFDVMQSYEEGFVNTVPGDALIIPDTIVVDIEFTQPLLAGDIGAAPYNPFLISGMRRGYEVHLPGFEPTDLADETLFGTVHDNTIPSQGSYYKTANNLPWALNLPNHFEYPVENRSIHGAYLHFSTWAQSGGLQYSDWYKNLGGYRNSSRVY